MERRKEREGSTDVQSIENLEAEQADWQAEVSRSSEVQEGKLGQRARLGDCLPLFSLLAPWHSFTILRDPVSVHLPSCRVLGVLSTLSLAGTLP